MLGMPSCAHLVWPQDAWWVLDVHRRTSRYMVSSYIGLDIWIAIGNVLKANEILQELVGIIPSICNTLTAGVRTNGHFQTIYNLYLLLNVRESNCRIFCSRQYKKSKAKPIGIFSATHPWHMFHVAWKESEISKTKRICKFTEVLMYLDTWIQRFIGHLWCRWYAACCK